jgi:hypothetical protein
MTEEVQSEYIAKMGEALGPQYAQLCQELIRLHANWHEYVVLFGTKPERKDLLNRAGGSFFRMLQDELLEAILLHIARLTDAPVSRGQRNLTILNFANLIEDAGFKEEIKGLVAEAIKQTEFARRRRNKRIAHLDLKLALDEKVEKPLEGGSRKQVADGLESIAAVMNAVAECYEVARTEFYIAKRLTGALDLIHLIDDGQRARGKAYERLEKEEPLADDFVARKL